MHSPLLPTAFIPFSPRPGRSRPGYVGRFAPSPSGPLHAGSVVAALASYLDARAHDGVWLLRIEDIDPPRVEPGSDITIRQQLRFLGMHWDAPPLYQSARVDRYQAVFAALQAQGLIYGCGCTRREIIQAARQARERIIAAHTTADGPNHEAAAEAPSTSPDIPPAAVSSAPVPVSAGDETPYPGTCRHGLPAGRTARAWRFRIDPQAGNGDHAPLVTGGIWQYHTPSTDQYRTQCTDGQPDNQSGSLPPGNPRPEDQPHVHVTGGTVPNPLPDETNVCDFPAILRATAPNVEAGNKSVSGTHNSQPERQVGEGSGQPFVRGISATSQGPDPSPARDGSAWNEAEDIVCFHDRWLGPQQQIPRLQCGDFILRRADGVWAYQLGVVVDDAESGVTDVVRGADLLSSTGRQILLLRALGAPIPRYMHLPLVMGDSGQKLSKQNGAPGVDTSGRIDAVDILEEAARALGLRSIGTRDAQRWLHAATEQWRERLTG